METADRPPEAFADALETLKRRGCALLVVGPDGGTTRCVDLLGEDEQERKRLLVDARQGSDPDGEGDPSFVRAGVGDVRSASAAASLPDDVPPPEAPDVDAVADELIDRIDRLDDNGLAPGELRVCLGDLGTLTSDRPGDPTAFLETVTERIREANGMGHAHLSDTSPLRAAVEPLFEITVEVRPAPEGRQQRWLLHEAGLDSGWVTA